MTVYGWECVGPLRGDLLAAKVEVERLDYGLEMLAAELGWERAFTSFREARAAFLIEMREQDADAELIDLAAHLKASHVPVDDQTY